jgi:hypothetical protein
MVGLIAAAVHVIALLGLSDSLFFLVVISRIVPSKHFLKAVFAVFLIHLQQLIGRETTKHIIVVPILCQVPQLLFISIGGCSCQVLVVLSVINTSSPLVGSTKPSSAWAYRRSCPILLVRT